MPEGGVAAEVTTFADETVGVADVLDPQQVRLRHRPVTPLFRGIGDIRPHH